jgi:hypothetical protein
MAKYGDDFFGDMFDFDGDGKTDIVEEAIGFQIFEEIMKEDAEEDTEEEPYDGTGYDSDYHDSYVSRKNKFKKSSPPLSATHNNIDTAPSANAEENNEPVHYQMKTGASSEKPSTDECFSSYKAAKEQLVYALLRLIGMAVLWIVGTSILFLIAVSVSKDTSSAIGFALILGIGSFILYSSNALYPFVKNLLKTKRAWVDSLDYAEQSKHKKKRILAIVIAALIILAGLAALITPAIVKSSQDSSIFSEAKSLMKNGEYNSAKKLLRDRYSYGNDEADSLIYLCSAYYDYDRGNIASAYYDLSLVDFDLLDPELRQESEAFYKKVKAEKEEHDKEYDKQREQERQEYENKIRTGIPFVGLSESRIGDTSLGKPDPNFRRVPGTVNGESTILFRYDYIRDKKIIFSVYCYDGRVVIVEDYRSFPLPTKKPSSSSSSGSSSYVYPDPKEFDDPSDFYYWYYDEFVDYEEAEEYYYSHGGR